MTLAQMHFLRRELHGRLDGRRTAIAVAQMTAASALLGRRRVRRLEGSRRGARASGLSARSSSVGVGLSAGARRLRVAVHLLRIPEARQIERLRPGRLRRRGETVVDAPQAEISLKFRAGRRRYEPKMVTDSRTSGGGTGGCRAEAGAAAATVADHLAASDGCCRRLARARRAAAVRGAARLLAGARRAAGDAPGSSGRTVRARRPRSSCAGRQRRAERLPARPTPRRRRRGVLPGASAGGCDGRRARRRVARPLRDERTWSACARARAPSGARIDALGGPPAESATAAPAAPRAEPRRARGPRAIADATAQRRPRPRPAELARCSRAPSGRDGRAAAVARGRPAGAASCATPRLRVDRATWVAGRDSLLHRSASPRAARRRQPRRPARRRRRDARRRRALRPRRALGALVLASARAGRHQHRRRRAARAARRPRRRVPAHRRADAARCASAPRPTRSPGLGHHATFHEALAGSHRRPTDRGRACATSTASSASTTPTATGTATACCAASPTR